MHYSIHRTLTRLELGQVVFQRVLYLAYTALCRLLVRAWQRMENISPLPDYVMQDVIQTTRSMQHCLYKSKVLIHLMLSYFTRGFETPERLKETVVAEGGEATVSRKLK